MNNKLLLIVFFILTLLILTVPMFASESPPFNPDGNSVGTRFYLFGPDAYFNMESCESMLEDGEYEEYNTLLNYPIGENSRPPLFTTIAVGVTLLVEPILGDDALGWVMLILPSIYGALLIFPIYYLGKEIFNE